MPFDWGPHFIVPSKNLKEFSGVVRLREKLDEELLQKELQELGLPGAVVNISNPWYYRKRHTESWIKIGESEDRHENFPVRWDTTRVENGSYEVLGLMHVFIRRGEEQHIIARQNIVEVEINNERRTPAPRPKKPRAKPGGRNRNIRLVVKKPPSQTTTR